MVYNNRKILLIIWDKILKTRFGWLVSSLQCLGPQMQWLFTLSLALFTLLPSCLFFFLPSQSLSKWLTWASSKHDSFRDIKLLTCYLGLQDQIVQEKEKWKVQVLLKVKPELTYCHFWLFTISKSGHSKAQIQREDSFHTSQWEEQMTQLLSHFREFLIKNMP